MTTAIDRGTRPSAAPRRTRRIEPPTRSVHLLSERELTDRLVDRVIPAIVRSQLALQTGSGQSKSDAAALLANARRWTINLLIFLAAVRREQLPRPMIRRGVALLRSAIGSSDESRTQRPNISSLDEFFMRCAARSWRSLAPGQATLSTSAKKPTERSAVAESNVHLARALVAIFDDARIGQASSSGSEILEEILLRGTPSFTPRILGNLHETLLGRRLQLSDDGPRLTDDHGNRRKSGSFYTPAPLVRLLVERSLDPVLTPRLRQAARTLAAASSDRRRNRASSFAVIDPATGSGHFLTAAVEYATQAIVRASKKHRVSAVELARLIATPNRRKQAQLQPHVAPVQSDVHAAVKQVLLTHSIFGADTDAGSIELARLSLWLDSYLPAKRVKRLVGNLAIGDSLLSDPWDNGRRKQFDVVVGNPPYGTPKAAYRRRLHRALPPTRRNADLAAAFVERSLTLVAPDGQVGFVLPKPLTYSFAWRHLRQSLRSRTEWICDVRRGWEQVLAEQVLLVFSGAVTSRNGYRVGSLLAPTNQELPDIPHAWTERFGVLLSSLSTDDCRRLAAMRFAPQSVGDLCRTFRGLPWQRKLNAAGEFAVYGGRDLQRWGIRSTSGFATGETAQEQLKLFAQPKLLFQNIIAHIERPEPHVRLIGTFDRQGAVTLDTVNNLVPRTEGLNLPAILALLHSSPVNWLVYAIIYNRAIRTMHFDQYFLDKIPLPRDWERVAPRLGELSEICLATTERLEQAAPGKPPGRRNARVLAKLEEAQAEIDRIVAKAYGVR